MPAPARHAASDQPDMFGLSTVQPRTPPPPRPEFYAFPQAAAKRLNARIRWLYPCETLPWSLEELAARDEDFRLCVAELHPDFRGDLIARWEAEIARLTPTVVRD